MKSYVVARSANTNRPVCMHVVTNPYGHLAACGYNLSGASRDYTDTPLNSILCKTCAKIAER